MTLYVTKYALSDGIKARENLKERENGDVVGKPGVELFKMGRDVFRTREEAVKAAEAMRMKKIESLEEQISKLKKLSFD